MEPISAITAALVAGATAAASGVASDAVKDAYVALKTLLTKGYDVVSTRLVEKSPENASFRDALSKELEEVPAIAADPDVLEKTNVLQRAIVKEPEDKQRGWGIDVEEMIAAGNIIANNISGIRGKRMQAGGNIELYNVLGSGGGND